MKGIIPPFKATSILSYFIRGFTWTIPNDKNEIYLTFDDGPIPEVTPWVLDVLKSKNIKATFFCVGSNVEKNNEIYQRILNEGHAVGNHTQHHLSGWKSNNDEYKANIDLAAKYIKSNLFRPPYGQLSPNQFLKIKDEYKVIMWDVLSKDYDGTVDENTCLHNVIDNVKSGSIVVMHDSLKADCNIRATLEPIIDNLLSRNFVFRVLDNNIETDTSLYATT